MYFGRSIAHIFIEIFKGIKPSSTNSDSAIAIIHSIDRIDVNGDYCPENCRWGTLEEQNNNKTNNKYLEYDGEKLTIPQWSRKLGISRHVIYSRISAGWTTERIILQPVQKQSHR